LRIADVFRNKEPRCGLNSRKFNPKESNVADKTLNDLFIDTLKDIYFAERQIVKALPKMARAAQSPELKAAFKKHQEETQGQIERLQQVFELVGKPARGKTCEAIQGIIAECEEIMEEFAGSSALDAGLISSAQAVEHYEIARYGTLKNWATELGMNDAANLLDETLQEEGATDEALTQLANASINLKGKKKVA
jgi:ferritin-like metal-binding protein YciE